MLYGMEGIRLEDQKEPYDFLLEIGGTKLKELIPELQQSDEAESLVSCFVGDVLAAHGVPSTSFHRLSPMRQREILEEKGLTPESVFDGGKISDQLVAFYRKKVLTGPQERFDPLTDPNVEEF